MKEMVSIIPCMSIIGQSLLPFMIKARPKMNPILPVIKMPVMP